MLRLHRSERADALVAPLADVLAEPPDDPFAVDVVAVPTRGVERWLAQRLSHHLGTGPGGEAGIAANIRFDSPGRLLDDVVHAALGGGSTARRGPVVAGPPHLAPAGRRRRLRRRGVVHPARPPPGHRHRAPAPADGHRRRPAGTPHAGRGPPRRPVRLVRHPAPRDAGGLGPWVPRRRLRRGRPRRPGLAGHALAAPAGPARGAEPVGAARARRRRDSARTRTPSTCLRGSPSSGPPAWPRGACACCGRWPRTATSTSGSRIPRRRCGTPSLAARRRPAPPRGAVRCPRRPGIRCSPRWPAT